MTTTTAARTSPQVPVAVVGVGAIMPGSTDAPGFWDSILRGEDLITDVPRSHWLPEDYFDPDPSVLDKTYVRRGSFLPLVDFDPTEFGIPPSIIPATDTAQLFALKVADQTLRDALGDRYEQADRGRFGIILGSGNLELLSEIYIRLGRPMWYRSLRDLGFSHPDADHICDYMMKDYPRWQEATLPGGLGNIVAGRVANRLDLHGVNYTVDAACASSLAAVSAAVNELALGRADMIISGGVDALNNPCTFVSFCRTPALSPTQDCRPFAADADGTLLGEGVAMVALKRLADAERDGDRIYAVIRGIGASSDGHGSAIYAPTPGGQIRALHAAYLDAGYSPATVELLEAHGTGTVVGDRTEVTALTEVFGDARRDDHRWCALGSVKSQVGHTKSAAGAAGLLKAVLALHHHALPPTIKVTEPNPDLGLETSPFYLNTVGRPWAEPADHPRRASVSSFGFGGINFHIALEEAPHSPAPVMVGSPPAAGALTRSVATGAVSNGAALNGAGPVEAAGPVAAGSELVLFSGANAQEILDALRAVDLPDEDDRSLDSGRTAALAWASQHRFDPGQPVRLAVAAVGTRQLAARLDQAAALVARRPDESFTNPVGVHYQVDAGRPADDAGDRLAFLFPGQGSQYLGMGRDLALRYPAARQVWDRFGVLRLGDGAAAGGAAAGGTVADMVFPPPVFSEAEQAAQRDALTASEWAQPALAVHELALLAALTDVGVRPRAAAGHSFGELAALCAAGVLDAASLVALARRRGELVRDTAATAPGGMLAAVATPAEVTAALGAPEPEPEPGAGEAAQGELGRDVWMTNLNAPRQVVLSGTADGVVAAARRLAATGITTRRLDTAAGFHSPLLDGARDPLRRFVDDLEIRAPRFGVYAGADGRPYPSDPWAVRERIVDQLTTPVRFVDQIEAMYADGVRTFVEVGPGGTLTGLVDQILDGREHAAISLERRGQDGDATLMSALGRLAALGLDLDLDRLWVARGVPERREPVMTVKIDGSNYGRYYPSPELLATPAVQETSGDARSSNGFVWNEPGTEPPNVRSNRHVTSAAPASATEPAPPAVETGLAAETGPTGVHPEADARAGVGVDPGAVNGADTAGRSAAGGGAEVAEAMAPPDGDTPGVMSAAPFPSPAPAPESTPTPPPAPAPGPGPTPGPTSALGSAAPPALAAGPGEQPPLRLAPGWPEAVEQTHRQTAAAHTAYQQLMTEAHLEFLRVTGAVCSWLAGAPSTDGPHSHPRVVDGVSFGPAESSAPHTVAPPSAAPRGPSTAAAFAVTAPPPTPAPPPPMPTLPPAPATPAPAETGGWATAAPPTPTAGGPAPTVPAEPAFATPAPTGGPAPTEPAGASPTAPATGPAPAAEPEGGPVPAGMTPEEVTDLLFDVVSERTGYPKEVLNIDMELEGDLGIDSLKKVEILSALRQQVGDVAVDVSETDAIAELASLRTLGEVVELIRQRLGSPGGGDTPGADPESPGTGPASPGADPGSPGAGPDSSGAGPELATAAPGTAGGAPFRLSRFVAGLEKASAPGLAMRGLRGRPLTVVDGGSGVGAALVDELTHAGVAAELAVGRRPAAVLTRDRGGVVLLGGLAGPDTAATDGSPTGAMLEVQRDAFNWARAVAGSGLTEDADPGGRGAAVFVTVQDTGGDLGLGGARGDRAWLGGLAALATTAAAEWPSAAVKALDCERAGRSPAAVAAVVVAELLRGGDTPVVALRGDGTRLVPVVLPADTNMDADAARPASGAGPRTGSATASRPAGAVRTELETGPETVIAVTGGARGVTAAGVVELARRHRPRFVLLGRTALADEPPGLAGARDERALVRELARVSGTAGGPARLRARAREILAVREVRATLAALAEIGAPVRYHCLDVRDERAVAAAFDEVRREWGPVHGLVHGAGALADRLIVDKTDDDFARVFDTKVGGLRVLLEELADDPLRLLCLFTSVAGWFGNPGQSDYAMANATLDHVASAYQAAHPDCLVRSIAWGPWAGGMVGSLLAEAFTRRGIPPIPLPRGAQAFADELTGAPDGAPATAAGSTRVMIVSCDASVIGGAGRGPAAGVLGELAVHAGAQPWLVDHSPAGTAVLPLAMALDWLARGALALSPAVAGGVTLRDLRVLRKIALPELARGGHRFAVVAAPGRQPGETLLRVDGEGGVPHYSARFGPDRSPPTSGERWPTPAGLVDHPEESARHRDRIYGQGALFHGPRFHAITWLMGMSPDGAEGTVVGVDELAWGGDGWYFDVAALDGGMQLAGLWAWRALGGAIPVAVRECRIHRPGLLREPARGVVHARGVDGVHTHCDVAVLDGDGAPRIELLGVELVLRPDRMSRSR